MKINKKPQWKTLIFHDKPIDSSDYLSRSAWNVILMFHILITRDACKNVETSPLYSYLYTNRKLSLKASIPVSTKQWLKNSVSNVNHLSKRYTEEDITTFLSWMRWPRMKNNLNVCKGRVSNAIKAFCVDVKFLQENIWFDTTIE